MSVHTLIPTLLLSALPLIAIAGTPINETRALDARGKVEISNVKGRIQVRTWDKPQVHITGTLGQGVERLDIQGGEDEDRDSLSIKVRYPRNDGDSESTDLIVDVPVLASLEIDGVAADISVTGTAGRSLDINSVSGGVTVAGAPQSADIESVSGDLRLTLNSSKIDVQTVSGGIALGGRIKGEVHAETVSGNLGIDSKGERLQRVSVNSVSGNAVLRVALADDGEISMESVSGDISLRTPASLSAKLSAESFSGSLDAPDAKAERPQFGSGSSLDKRYGSGRGEIRIQTFSGSVKLAFD